ncbi:unnamed protein product [Anisakis simplex]|uniref:Uncharacterized protein n=1 Tax=Anisakis simplex TaxID=6269 RepID=A0A3P6QDN5_ANISI|nr:unnamed protein product [Anisakis simplex]
MPNGLWVHPSGSVQEGMTNSAFNGEVWSVVLSQKPLKWHKNSVVIPKLDEQELVIEIADDGMIYVADNHQGVFATKIEY